VKAAFFTLHRDLPREGPGSAAEVHWALARIAPPARVLDLACGPGADTVTLARALPGARIDGLDITPHFVADARAATAAFADRVTINQGDMREITGPYDLIWCMGAVYGLGIETALPLWRKALAPGGILAFSEPVLTETPPDPIVAEFWAGCPATGDAAAIAARIEACGYHSRATRLLTGAPWAAYYTPMQRRIAALRPGADAALSRALDDGQREIDLWRQASDRIAYLLTLAAPA
jgi:SAM-dependent methyltransferase